MRYSIQDLVARIDRLVSARPGRRVLIGLVGAPGSGKSTLADALVAALLDQPGDRAAVGRRDSRRPWIGSHVAHVPMDGFHLADIELDRLNRLARKGAPDTYDSRGYAALLRRIRDDEEDVWAPGFDREIEQPIAGSIPILRAARVVITEGNYLLLDDPQWASVAQLLDETWYCDLDDDVRLQRLIARHERFGKSPEHARAWATGTDQRNAEVIQATRSRADLVITEDVSDEAPATARP